MPEGYEDNDSHINKVVVVTGSGKGVGKIISTEFAKSGYYVMINDLEQVDELKLAAEEISTEIGDDNNNKVAYVVGDVSQEKVAITLIEETVRRFGRIGTLVNPAAISEIVQLSIYHLPMRQFPKMKPMLIPFQCQESTLSHLGSESNL